ncbi:hypothetical protein BJ508DRAFT_415697 [Ascobolus immersus RN42]|uniref:YCII-related domain-containing protein n=1 Tax=Ascobolus immersus RN42 TaxID=1160509 RepID=A0A3N4I712_ASCIM|nr:hypothetical protein BJ508DRAFT_415697 [Ascobolus immersus RN42]
MSAAAPTPISKHEWLCILPDQADAQPRRLEVRSQHLEGIKKAEAEGFFTFGGAFFADKFQEGVTPNFKGSVMIALGDNKEEVVAKLKEDVYTKNNVWDWEKVEIYPFRTAVRVPLPY